MSKNRCHLPPASADTKPAPISSIVKESGLYRPHVTPSLSIGKLLQCSIQKVSILMIFLLPIHQKLQTKWLFWFDEQQQRDYFLPKHEQTSEELSSQQIEQQKYDQGYRSKGSLLINYDNTQEGCIQLLLLDQEKRPERMLFQFTQKNCKEEGVDSSLQLPVVLARCHMQIRWQPTNSRVGPQGTSHPATSHEAKLPAYPPLLTIPRRLFRVMRAWCEVLQCEYIAKLYISASSWKRWDVAEKVFSFQFDHFQCFSLWDEKHSWSATNIISSSLPC